MRGGKDIQCFRDGIIQGLRVSLVPCLILRVNEDYLPVRHTAPLRGFVNTKGTRHCVQFVNEVVQALSNHGVSIHRSAVWVIRKEIDRSLSVWVVECVVRLQTPPSHDPLHMHPKEVYPVGCTPKEGLIETDVWKDTRHADFFYRRNVRC